MSSIWLDVLGWGGSALLIWSVLQTQLLRFRVLNLAASAVLVLFNGLLAIWPMVAMNLALCAINLWHLRRLVGRRHDDAAFTVLAVDGSDRYLQHLLAVHRADLLRFQPDLDLESWPADRRAFLVQLGDETVGIVLLRGTGSTVLIELDWVSERFRDLSPGEFVWRRSSLLQDLGITRVHTSPARVDAYYARLGWRREGDHWVHEVG